MEAKKKSKIVRRLIPCPQYDVSGMEYWLSEMAEQGLVLEKDGLFCGIATFEKTVPQKIRYCLQAAGKSTSVWADNLGDPDEEEVELSKEFGWEYVAKRGEFYIYRTIDSDARDLHTDKEVQALAMDAVKKRQRDNVIKILCFLVIYPYIFLDGNVFLTTFHAGTPVVLIISMAILWMIINAIVQAVKLTKLRKRVLNGESLGSGKEWKKGVRFYHANNILRRCMYVVAIVVFFKALGNHLMYEDYIRIKEYTGDVPFKTIEDFIPDGKMESMGMKNWDTVREWSYFLSPVNYEWNEAVIVTMEDGTHMSAGLEVSYHETKADWIAKRLVKEYLRKGKDDKYYKPLEFEMQEVDEVVAYTKVLDIPNVIMRKGNKIIYASFFTSGDNAMKLELSEWAGYLAESLVE